MVEGNSGEIIIWDMHLGKDEGVSINLREYPDFLLDKDLLHITLIDKWVKSCVLQH